MTTPLQVEFEQQQTPVLTSLQQEFEAQPKLTPKPKSPSSIRYGLDDMIMHGLTLGWSEKGAAAIQALIGGKGDFSTRYREALAERMADRAAAKAQYGLPGSALEIGASAIPFAVGGAAAAPATLAGKVALGATAGGVGGAVSGASEAPIGSEGQGAAIGGMTGGVIGGAIPVAGAVAGRALRLIPGVQSLADKLAKAGVPVRSSEAEAKNMVADYPGFAGKLSQLAEQASQIGPSDPAVTLAQLGDRQAMKQVFADVARESPKARQALVEFAEEQAKRAAPLYTEAYKEGITRTPAIDAALAHPEVAKAFTEAEKLLRPKGITMEAKAPNAAILTLAKTMSPERLAASDPRFAEALAAEEAGKKIPVQLLDEANKIMNDRNWATANPGAKIRSARDAQGLLLAEADQQVPVYGQARALAATYLQLRDALTKGKLTHAKEVSGLVTNKAFEASPGEVASIAAGRGYGWWHYALRTAWSGKPAFKSTALPLTKLLLVGSGGHVEGEAMGGASELAKLLSSLAAGTPANRVGGAALGGFAGGLGTTIGEAEQP